MLHKFTKSPHSQKQSPPTTSNMTLADMDLGISKPLQQQILHLYKSYLLSSTQLSNTVLNPVQCKEKMYLELVEKVKRAVLGWYGIGKGNGEMGEIEVLLCPSVVSLLSHAVVGYSCRGDAVMVITPVYASYMGLLEALKRKVVPIQMKFQPASDGVGKFQVDFREMEDQIVKNKVKVLIISQPHNPSGRVWSHKQVQTIVDICHRNSVAILSDQILSQINLLQPPFPTFCTHIPTHPQTIILNSLSKSFNMASLQCGYCILPKKISKPLQTQILAYGDNLDQLALCAMLACFSEEGRQWLGIVRGIVGGNWGKLVEWVRKGKRGKGKGKGRVQVGLLEGGFIVYMRLDGVFEGVGEMRVALDVSGVMVLELGNNYVPEKKDSLEIRICIACEEQQFDIFLERMDKVMEHSPIYKRPKL